MDFLALHKIWPGHPFEEPGIHFFKITKRRTTILAFAFRFLRSGGLVDSVFAGSSHPHHLPPSIASDRSEDRSPRGFRKRRSQDPFQAEPIVSTRAVAAVSPLPVTARKLSVGATAGRRGQGGRGFANERYPGTGGT